MFHNKNILTQIRAILHITMGTWDELCILCGVAASGGCSTLGSKYGFDEDVKKIANDIAPGDEEIYHIVRDMLRATFSDATLDIGYPYPWRPRGMGFQRYNEMLSIAIGHFDENGECERRGKLVRDGRGVEVRRVDGLNGGDFTEVVRVVNRREKRVNAASICSAFDNTPNFALCEPCYHYLDAWLARQDLPSRSCAFPEDQEPMSLGEELYEIVNSQQELRAHGTGTLPIVDYDGIEETVNQWQDCFLPGRRGVRYLQEAIAAGLRGANLIPALLQDCRAYMFMRPNIYPEPPATDRTPTFTIYRPSPGAIMPGIGNLPNELLLPILHDLPLPSLLALASTCRSLRALILEPSFLDRVLTEAMTRGSLRWLLPVEPVHNEKRRAYDALRLWFAEEHRPEPFPDEPEPAPVDEEESADDGEDESEERGPDEIEEDTDENQTELQPVQGPSVVPLVKSPHFPRLAFVRECWASDSMRNRRRLWGQVSQFEELWRDYRLHGWRVDRFFHPSDNMQRDPQDQ